jgi:hypothetical protein
MKKSIEVLKVHSDFYSGNFGWIPADNHIVGIDRTQIVEFHLKWPNFIQISQKSTSFGQNVSTIFVRNPTGCEFWLKFGQNWRNISNCVQEMDSRCPLMETFLVSNVVIRTNR